MSVPQNSEKVRLLISRLRKSIDTTVNIDDLLPILDEFYNFLTTESKQLPASKIKNFILKALFLFKSAIKANKFIDDNETQIIYKHKLCKITSFYIDVELFSVGIGKDSSENIINRISTTIDSYFNEPENIFKIFRASLQIRKGKQIMKFKDIVIALFTKYFYRQARAQPLEIDDVLFLEQLSIYKIWSSLLDSQHHKDELSEMVINYMVPLHKQILMSQLGITDVDNFMNEALKTTSQQVIEKAIVNNTEIIDLDPDNSNAYVPSNINLTLLDYLNEEKVEDVCMPISWLDSLSIKTTERLIEKIVIIEIDDDDDDEIVIQDLPVPEVVDIDLNIVKNLSLDDKIAVPEQEIVVEACNDKREGIQNNDESFLKSDIPRTYSRKEKTDIAYKSFDTMEIGTMTDLMAHTKDTEMCVENESTTEPALSQSEIDDHLATSPLKIVKSFMCKTPLTPHPMFETNSIRPESVASKICIMERKTYIKEEETPIYGPINNIPNYVSKKEHPQRTKLNFDETALQYEVSPRRNRIFGFIRTKKPKIKSVRFADELETNNNNVPLETYYGTTADSIVALDKYLRNATISDGNKIYSSFVRLDRDITCEKMIAAKTSTPPKKCIKVPENNDYETRTTDTEMSETTSLPYPPFSIKEGTSSGSSSNMMKLELCQMKTEQTSAIADKVSVDEEFNSDIQNNIETIKYLYDVLDNSTDKANVREDISDIYNKTNPLLENPGEYCDNSIVQINEICNNSADDNTEELPEEESHNSTDNQSEESTISVFLLNDEQDELVSQMSTEIDKSAETITNECDTFVKLISDVCLKSPSYSNKSADDKTEELLEEECHNSTDNQSEESTISVFLLNGNHNELVSQLSTEIDKSVETITNECETFVELISDVGVKSPNYSNIEYLEEIEDSCDKNEYLNVNDNVELTVLCNNDILTGFDSRASEYNNEIIPNVNSYEEATGEFVEAYLKYIKSGTKPVTDLLTTNDHVMSPINPPDSTTIPTSTNKKRGRPKGSKNRVKIINHILLIEERTKINPQYPKHMKTYSKTTKNE